jgi:uncharacterized protein (DUF2384 family)
LRNALAKVANSVSVAVDVFDAILDAEPDFAVPNHFVEAHALVSLDMTDVGAVAVFVGKT